MAQDQRSTWLVCLARFAKSLTAMHCQSASDSICCSQDESCVDGGARQRSLGAPTQCKDFIGKVPQDEQLSGVFSTLSPASAGTPNISPASSPPGSPVEPHDSSDEEVPKTRAPVPSTSHSAMVLLGRVSTPAAVMTGAKAGKGAQDASPPTITARKESSTKLLPEGFTELPLKNRLAELLKCDNLLKSMTEESFQQIAESDTRWRDASGKPALDIMGLARLRALVAKELGISDQALGNLQDAFVKFDFNGDGVLQEHECLSIFKCYLRKFQKTHVDSSASEISIPFKSLHNAGYKLSKDLGSGNQGIIKMATNLSGKEFCVKLVPKHTVKAFTADAFHKEFEAVMELKGEFEIMSKANSVRVARTYEIFQDNAFYYMVNEPYFGGDFTKLRNNASKRGVAITQDWWRKIFRQCCEGLQYLHERGVIHCDIKEPNLMIKTDNFHDPDVVIIDFGVGQEAVDDRQRLCGTPGYIPPETLETKHWFPKGDCFSLGVTMMQLIIDQVPEIGNGPGGTPVMLKLGIFSLGTKVLDEIHRNVLLLRPPFHRMPKEFTSLTRLLEQLLEKKQDKRITAAQALQDPWFSELPVGDVPSPAPSPATQPCRPAIDVAPHANAGGALGVGICNAALAPNRVQQHVQRQKPIPMAAQLRCTSPPQTPCRIIAPSAVPSVGLVPTVIPRHATYPMPGRSR